MVNHVHIADHHASGIIAVRQEDLILTGDLFQKPRIPFTVRGRPAAALVTAGNHKNQTQPGISLHQCQHAFRGQRIKTQRGSAQKAAISDPV